MSADTTQSLKDQFSDLSLQAETFSFVYRQDTGWSAPFPEVDSEMTLVVVFASNDFWEDRTALDELKDAFPLSVVVGCGGKDTLHNGNLLTDCISVGVIKFQTTEIKLAVAELQACDRSKSAGRELARSLKHPDLKGILLFANGLLTEATDLVSGIQEILPAGIPIVGGLASDRNLRHCWINANGKLRDEAVCAVGFIGDKVELVCASGGGWTPASEKYVATKTDGKTIYEIDGKCALDVLNARLESDVIHENPWAIGLVNQPIALRLAGVDLVRSIIATDSKNGSVTLAGDIPQGVEIQFMNASVDDIIDGVDEAAHGIRMKTVGLTDNSLSIVVSCAGRRAILCDRTSEEASRLRTSIGENIPQVGMYGLGEILTTTDGHPQVHNLTMAAAVIREH